MPRPRVTLALLVLAACSGGPPQPPAASGSPSRPPASRSPASPPAPRALVERDRALFVVGGPSESRVSAAGFYPGGSRTSEPPVAVSPNRRWVLAYTATRPGWFVLPLGGGPPVRLPGAAKLPVWSRDSTIAYVADGDLHLFVPGGRDVALLASAPEGCCFALAWSADGRRIAMEGFDRTLGREQIWVVDRTGKNLTRIWAGKAAASPRGWALGFTPDGERVVSANADPPVSAAIDGADRSLVGVPVVRDEGLAWWRNRLLVHTGTSPKTIAWEDTATGDLLAVPEPAALATETSLAPGGSPLGITLLRRPDGKTALFTVRPDGTALRRLIDWGEAIAAIGWTADGRWLVYQLAKSRSVRAVPAGGGTPRTLGEGRLRAAL